MRQLLCLTTMCLCLICHPAQAVEIVPLADCTVKVFSDISRNRAWSGTSPASCKGGLHVEQRSSGIFVTTWSNATSEQGWDRLSFSAAMGTAEIANTKLLKRAGRDIRARAARLEACLNSILRLNDPLECRDHADKSYVAGEKVGIEYDRKVWLEDNGRHTVVEYAYGDSSAVVTPPADLFGGPALPPGTKLNIHVLDNQ